MLRLFGARKREDRQDAIMKPQGHRTCQNPSRGGQTLSKPVAGRNCFLESSLLWLNCCW